MIIVMLPGVKIYDSFSINANSTCTQHIQVPMVPQLMEIHEYSTKRAKNVESVKSNCQCVSNF